MDVASGALTGYFRGFNRWHTAVSFSHSVQFAHDSVTHCLL